MSATEGTRDIGDVINGGIRDTIDGADNFITNVFNSIDNTVWGLLDPIKDFAVVLASIGIIIYLAKVLLPMIESNRPIDLYPLIRPICIALVITNFSVVTSLLNETLSGISNGVKSTYETEKVETISFDQAREKGKKKLEEQKAENEKKKSLLKSIGAFIFEGAKGYFQQEIGEAILTFKYDILFPALAWIAEFLGGIAYVIINMMSRFYLVFLAIFGPVTLALSQFTPLQSSFRDWVARYISVGLWPAMANLLRYLNNFIIVKMNSSFGDSFDAALVMFLALIMVSYFYFEIPEISEYIVSGGGAGNLNSAMLKSTMKTTAVTGAVAGGLGAGVMRGIGRGVVTNSFEETWDKKLTKSGERTGSNGRINRATQYVGDKVGRAGRGTVDIARAMMHGNFTYKDITEYKQGLTQMRVEKGERFAAENNKPEKKDLRKQAKQLLAMKSRGVRLSPDQQELVDRYKEGRYKGDGKFELTNAERREQDSKEFRGMLFKGFQRGAEMDGFRGPIDPSKVDGWHTPLVPTKRQTRLINKL